MVTRPTVTLRNTAFTVMVKRHRYTIKLTVRLGKFECKSTVEDETLGHVSCHFSGSVWSITDALLIAWTLNIQTKCKRVNGTWSIRLNLIKDLRNWEQGFPEAVFTCLKCIINNSAGTWIVLNRKNQCGL